MDMQSKSNCDQKNILATNLLIDYLLPNWFHTIRQPLTIISTAAGFLQILSDSEGYCEDVFSDKLQMVQNQSRKTELLLNDLKFFLAGNQVSVEKISVQIQKMFELLGRDLTCWNITSQLTVNSDFHTQNSVSICLAVAAIYKILGNSSTSNKTVRLSISCVGKDCKEQRSFVLKSLQSFNSKENLHLTEAIETIVNSGQDITFDVTGDESSLNICINLI